MEKKHLTLIIGLLAFASFGQNHFPLVDDKAKWVESSYQQHSGFSDYQLSIKGDTSLYNVEYKILEKLMFLQCVGNADYCDTTTNLDSSKTLDTIGFIREDTSSRTI